MVDQNDNIFYTEQYLKNVEQAALQGIAFPPVFGFSAVRNVNHHSKYPYDPYYGEISPRIGAAWNVMPSTVIRGGDLRGFWRPHSADTPLLPLRTPGPSP